MIVILGAIICFFYFSHQKAVKECKELCVYQARSGVWGYEGEYKSTEVSKERLGIDEYVRQELGIKRSFPKQKQCIDYCLDQN